MKIRFEQTATQIHKGIFNIRADFYPGVEDLSYESCYIDVLDREPTKEEWLKHEDNYADLEKAIGTHKKVKPALCAFLWLPENSVNENLTELVLDRFSPDDVATIDYYMSRSDGFKFIRRMVLNRIKTTYEKVQTADTADFLNSANQKIKDLEIDLVKGTARTIEPATEYVGTDSVGGGGYDSGSSTRVSLDNPATVDFIMDSWKIENLSDGFSCIAASYQDNGSDEYECHASQSAGSLSSGIQTVTGLSVEFLAASGKYVGGYMGTIRAQDISGAGKGEVSGEYADPGDKATFTMSTWSAYLLGSGEPIGGAGGIGNPYNMMIGQGMI